MKIQLIDTNVKMVQNWKVFFDNEPNVKVYLGGYFDFPTSCIVSPANSFGFMDGGIDYIISETIGWHLQKKLQKIIESKYNGELLVGQSVLIETQNKTIPYLISAPTMRVPMILGSDSINPYLAAKAIFIKALKNKDKIKTITICGLGTGAGQIPYHIAAYQMYRAYKDVIENDNKVIETWQERLILHQSLTNL
ncbi:macro domain-containing protein [Aquimarina muelleri]|uniref:macro domain-containing protein n=1 Tax=Aquimarina muelleri TaxID=279356 RepID=UPI003F6856D9